MRTSLARPDCYKICRGLIVNPRMVVSNAEVLESIACCFGFLIKKLKPENRIFLKGFSPHPMGILLKSDIFAVPSKYKGFSLALVEAMSVGLPVIRYSTCSGVNESIKDRYNGYLCADDADLKSSLPC